MRVLVLGGTGAMGKHLVRLLADGGAEVTVTSRKPRSEERGVRYVQGDAQDMRFLGGVLSEGWDAIVDFMVYSTSDFESRLTPLLSATSQYVFLSSARVYADSKVPLTEDSPRLLDMSQDTEFLATDEYALAKARQENFLIDSGSRNWTIFRPYITYSEDRLQLGVLEKEGWLYRALRGRTIVFSGDINAKATTLTYGLDVSKSMQAVIGNADALGEIFHVTASAPVLWRDVLSVYLQVVERHMSYQPEVLLQDLQGFRKCHPAQYQISYDRLFDRKFDNQKIGRHVCVDSFVKTEAGLKECLEKFLRTPKFGEVNWKSEALKDRAASERTPLSEIQGMKKKLTYLFHRYVVL